MAVAGAWVGLVECRLVGPTFEMRFSLGVGCFAVTWEVMLRLAREEEKSGYVSVCLVTIFAYVVMTVGGFVKGTVKGVSRVGCASLVVTAAVVRGGRGGEEELQLA